MARSVSWDLCEQVLAYAQEFYDDHGYMPTCAQMAKEMSKSTYSISMAIRQLWKAGSLGRVRLTEHSYAYVLPSQLKASAQHRRLTS